MMDHPIFEHLPPGEWKKGHPFRYSAWRESPDPQPPAKWSCAQQAGDLERDGDSSWTLVSGLPRDARVINCINFADGLAIRYERQGKTHSLELWAIHSSGIAGISTDKLIPRLDAIADQAEETESSAHLRTRLSQAFLGWKEREDGTQFVLFTGSPTESLDIQSFESILDFDLREDAVNRYDQRMPFWNLWQQHHETAKSQHTALEALIYALRAPSPSFVGLWPESEPGVMDVNAAASHILAWTHIDIRIAQDMFRSMISLRTSDGRTPTRAYEGNEGQDAATAWPCINQTALLIIRELDDPTTFSGHLSKLHANLLRTIAYFDHSQNDIHSWHSPREALIPDIMDEDLATVDCSALLLAEIEAHEEILDLMGKRESTDLTQLHAAREQIQTNLTTFFYDTNTQSFRDRYMHGDPVTRITLSNVLPLLTSYPDPATTNVLQQQLMAPKLLKATHGIRGWQQWDSDEIDAPVELGHQALLTLLCEKRHDRWTQPLLRSWMDGIRKGAFDEVEDAGLLASWSLRIHQLRYHPNHGKEQSPLVQWMEKHRVGVIGLPTAAALVLILGITFAFIGKKSPPRATIEAMVGLAGKHYQVAEYEESENVLLDLMDANVRTPAVLELLAKTYFQQGDFEKAEEYFNRAIQIQNRPQSQFNLALTLFRQGRMEEAQSIYTSLREEFAELSPTLAERAEHCLELIAIKAPPQPLERDPSTNG